MASQTLSPAVSSPQPSPKVTLICNECGKKRSVSAEGQYNDRCPRCGSVDWEVVDPVRRPPVHPQLHQGSTITDLDKMVERCLTTGPLMTVAQIRQLLRVEQACENCEATGIVESRGLSPEVSQDRCPACKGRGYVMGAQAVQQ